MSSFPKLDTPTYTIKLPMTKIDVTYRPYLTKEEKLLLMALETKDPKIVVSTIRQVAINCIIQPKDLDVDTIPLIDLEYLFLQLRAKSKGETLEARFICRSAAAEGDEEEVCGNPLLLSVRVDELKVVESPTGIKFVIPLTDQIGVKMRMPRYIDSSKILMGVTGAQGQGGTTEQAYGLLRESIEAIYDKDQVYQVTKENIGELDEFLESLTFDQFHKLEQFFDELPKIDYTFHVKCNKCGFDHTLYYKDIGSFF